MPNVGIYVPAIRPPTVAEGTNRLRVTVTAKERVVQLGVPPVRVDLLTSITGVEWEQAARHRIVGIFGDVSTYFIGRGDFLLNKKACGRHKDLADVEALGEQLD